MATKAFRCAETGQLIGGDTGVDPYKHTVQLFHLEPRGLDELLAAYKGHDDERSKRIVANLTAAKVSA